MSCLWQHGISVAKCFIFVIKAILLKQGVACRIAAFTFSVNIFVLIVFSRVLHFD